MRLQGNNPMNDPDSKNSAHHSLFKPNRSELTSLLFSKNTPFYGTEVVPGDKADLRSSHQIDSMAIKTPVLSPVKMYKDFFFVPVNSILPENCDLLVTNPLSGDDIIPNDVNAGVFHADVRTLIEDWRAEHNGVLTAINSASTVPEESKLLIKALVHCFTVPVYLCSGGSVLQRLGYSVSKNIICADNGARLIYFDEYFEALCSAIKHKVVSFQVYIAKPTQITSSGSVSFSQQIISVDTTLPSDKNYPNKISFDRFIELLGDGLLVTQVLSSLTNVSGASLSGVTYVNNEGNRLKYTSFLLNFPASSSADEFINLWRVFGYQLISASFYTDDSVDDIYNANLYHNNLFSWYRVALGSNYAQHLNYPLNGVLHRYDATSASIFRSFTSIGFDLSVNTASNTDVIFNASTTSICSFVAILNNIFGFTRSLKFRDYFCGSRPHPLAVGSYSIPVVGSSVDVIDVTKNIMIQKYLNQVNRLSRKVRDYVKGIFNVLPSQDFRDPILLSSTCDDVGSEQTQNTGDGQLELAMPVTSHARSSSSRYSFHSEFDRFGVIVGIVRFDMPRFYSDTRDRSFFHVDRYNMFNPYMQNIGDQEVSESELVPQVVRSYNFGYKLRYSEYKETFDHAAGIFGVSGLLPGYALVSDSDNYRELGNLGHLVLSSDFIRSRGSELDVFFVVPPLYSPAGRFHFLCRFDTEITLRRPMEHAPSIL